MNTTTKILIAAVGTATAIVALHTLTSVQPDSEPVGEPTPEDELCAFLAKDTTDSDHEYVLGTYDCIEFSIDLAEKLKSGGYDAGVVHKNALNHEVPTGHATVWVNLHGKIIYIEPQTDETTTPEDYADGINDTEYEIEEYNTSFARTRLGYLG